ncbi:septum formation protein Maf [Novosphingobium sp. FSY-8]|uniref:Nucleoside triphosphate pyrophosphatase n=1 Tax=Novosphingobium ovatum TaxID=1908523 RepID=A0ABW9XHL0_9SPHN|nr:Maf family protein [Novosphingobium ovatum]NBC37976.1 septum formation protein Maf [Novosphingobium ovatum]
MQTCELVLASQSFSRRTMLGNAGVIHKPVPAHINERALEDSLGKTPAPDVALALASAKAQAVSADHPGALVLGSDSLVVVDGRRFDKPTDRDNAADHLRAFSGRVMELHSAAALVRDGAVVWGHADVAYLHVHTLSDAFIAAYLDAEWPEVAGCVGVFRLEALGVRLFEKIDGDHFTVLGMPLLPVLNALRQHGVLIP